MLKHLQTTGVSTWYKLLLGLGTAELAKLVLICKVTHDFFIDNHKYKPLTIAA